MKAIAADWVGFFLVFFAGFLVGSHPGFSLGITLIAAAMVIPGNFLKEWGVLNRPKRHD